MTDKDYGKFAKDRSPRSPLLKDVLLAFVVGGLICVIGQALSDIYNKLAGFGKEDARILSTISLVFIAALLTALKIYDNIAKFAGRALSYR